MKVNDDDDDDDDDDDNNHDNFFLVCLFNERWLVLFPAVTIVIDPHHRESLIRH